MLVINRSISVPDDELVFSFSRSSGPGGQNVNKVNTKATLRWQVGETTSLPDAIKQRFIRQQTHRINQLGELIVSSQRYREQLRNRHDCLEKLRVMLVESLHVPKVRKKKRISNSAKRRRLQDKRQQSEKKQARRIPPGD